MYRNSKNIYKIYDMFNGIVSNQSIKYQMRKKKCYNLLYYTYVTFASVRAITRSNTLVRA